jgi:hypothetical protein
VPLPASLRSALNLPSGVGVDRAQILAAGQGLITQNFDRQTGFGGQILADGTAYFMLVPLCAGDVISNISIHVSTIGVTPTVSKVGLYSKAGILLAASAELGAAWTTATGTKTAALITPFTVPADDVYYIAVLCKAATLPTCTRGPATTSFSGVGSGAVPYGVQTGQTDLPSPATIAFGSGAPFALWVGIS